MVEEVLEHEVVIEADNQEEAEEKFWDMYRNEEIVLDSGDYVSTDVTKVREL